MNYWITSLIIFGCFLLGAFIDKYLRMRAIREFARRWKFEERFESGLRVANRNARKAIDDDLVRYADGHGNDITHIANGEPL